MDIATILALCIAVSLLFLPLARRVRYLVRHPITRPRSGHARPFGNEGTRQVVDDHDTVVRKKPGKR
jgi:hypothetical protein